MSETKTLSLNTRYYMAAVMADFFTVAISLALAVLLRFGHISAFPVTEFIGTASFFMLGYYVISVMENLYSIRTTLNRPMLLYRTLRMTLIVTGSFMLLLFLFKESRLLFIDSRFVIVFNMLIWLIATLAVKTIILPALFKSFYGGKRSSRSNLLIAGNPSRNKSIATLLRRSSVYASERRVVQWPEALPADPDELTDLVFEQMNSRKCSGAVILFDQTHDFSCIANCCIKLNDAGVPFVIYAPGILDLGYFDPWFSLSDYGALTFLKKGKQPIEISLRRFSNILLSFTGLIFLSPVFLATALSVKITSKGKILFKQERVGKNLKKFGFLKFRSMKEGGTNVQEHKKYFKDYANGKTAQSDGNGSSFKLNQTSRVTGIGKVIRKTSIDELPQLVNVLRGEMAIVGPRPCIQYELEHYSDWQRRRFTVNPGLTGIWQVYGRSRLPFDQAQFLDFLYTIDKSHSLDFRLIMKTIPVVLFGKGGL
ncbi:MAG: sugar transferase [Candidatus Fermentibacteria bacterium]|nr:sugar transferase [Candidatus Fermentibacteria bacterium]